MILEGTNEVIEALKQLSPANAEDAAAAALEAKRLAEDRTAVAMLTDARVIDLLLEKSNGVASTWIACGLSKAGYAILDGKKDLAFGGQPSLPAVGAQAAKKPSALEVLMQHPHIDHKLFCAGFVDARLVGVEAANRGITALTRAGANGQVGRNLLKLLHVSAINTLIEPLANDTKSGGKQFVESVLKSITQQITPSDEGVVPAPTKSFPLAVPEEGSWHTVQDNITAFLSAAMTNPQITNQFITGKALAVKERASDAEIKAAEAKKNGAVANGKHVPVVAERNWFIICISFGFCGWGNSQASVLKPIYTRPTIAAVPAANPPPIAEDTGAAAEVTPIEKVPEQPFSGPELLMNKFRDTTKYSASVIVEALFTHKYMNALAAYIGQMPPEKIPDIFDGFKGVPSRELCLMLTENLNDAQAGYAAKRLTKIALNEAGSTDAASLENARRAHENLSANHGELARELATRNNAVADSLVGFMSNPRGTVTALHEAVSRAIEAGRDVVSSEQFGKA